MRFFCILLFFGDGQMRSVTYDRRDETRRFDLLGASNLSYDLFHHAFIEADILLIRKSSMATAAPKCLLSIQNWAKDILGEFV